MSQNQQIEHARSLRSQLSGLSPANLNQANLAQTNLAQTNLIVPHLPALRRYAVALTGSSSSGDAYVVACLEAILEAPELISQKMPLRLALFRAFADIWACTNSDREYVTTVHGYKPLFMLLQMLDPLSRQAVLLTTLASFTYAEAGLILKFSEDDMRAICLRASDFLQGQADDEDVPEDSDGEDDDAISEPFFPPADAYFKGSLAWHWIQAQRVQSGT
jgi:DNA-directed RNA polymerase specialized sigma24 family protein